MKKYTIGNVLVVNKTQKNPYHGSICGDARVKALTDFKDGKESSDLVLWYAPCGGGAKIITADDVAWN